MTVGLVVASRLSPPPLVHTRRPGNPPISGTHARSTTCTRPLIKPASSQAPARGAIFLSPPTDGEGR